MIKRIAKLLKRGEESDAERLHGEYNVREGGMRCEIVSTNKYHFNIPIVWTLSDDGKFWEMYEPQYSFAKDVEEMMADIDFLCDAYIICDNCNKGALELRDRILAHGVEIIKKEMEE